MKNPEILGALALFTVLFAGMAINKGNTVLLVFTFYLLLFSLLGFSWKAQDNKPLEINPVWLFSIKAFAVLILLFYGSLFLSLSEIFPQSFPHLSMMFFPLLISVLVLLGDLNKDENLRKTLIFFLWFDLARWFTWGVLGKYVHKNFAFSKIKFKIEMLDNKK